MLGAAFNSATVFEDVVTLDVLKGIHDSLQRMTEYIAEFYTAPGSGAAGVNRRQQQQHHRYEDPTAVSTSMRDPTDHFMTRKLRSVIEQHGPAPNDSQAAHPAATVTTVLSVFDRLYANAQHKHLQNRIVHFELDPKRDRGPEQHAFPALPRTTPNVLQSHSYSHSKMPRPIAAHSRPAQQTTAAEVLPAAPAAPATKAPRPAAATSVTEARGVWARLQSTNGAAPRGAVVPSLAASRTAMEKRVAAAAAVERKKSVAAQRLEQQHRPQEVHEPPAAQLRPKGRHDEPPEMEALSATGPKIYLGITAIPEGDPSGIYVDLVESGPAQRAGMEVDDVIVSVGDFAVRTMEDMRFAVATKCRVGKKCQFQVLRRGCRKMLTLDIMTADPQFRGKPFYFEVESIVSSSSSPLLALPPSPVLRSGVKSISGPSSKARSGSVEHPSDTTPAFSSESPQPKKATAEERAVLVPRLQLPKRYDYTRGGRRIVIK